VVDARIPGDPQDILEVAMQTRTMLVTGAAGFIGSNLVDHLLSEGHRVVGFDDLSTGRPANLAKARRHGDAFAFYALDICDGSLGEVFERHRPETVMHLAAQASVVASMRSPSFDARVNILGLLEVLEASADAGVRKVVFAASGGTVYGESADLPLREGARVGSQPTSAYGISKKVAEDYLALFRRERGLDHTILALANVYGPRQDPRGEAGVVSIFGSKLIAGERPVIFGDGEQTRDYVFVGDVVRAFGLAGSPGRASGEFLNVGTGRETSVNELFRHLADVAGFHGDARYGPARPGELMRSVIDPTAAFERLGWQARTDLAEGLLTTLEWIRRDRDGRAEESGAGPVPPETVA
jgi:UDP-glucose 4-epimerase